MASDNHRRAVRVRARIAEWCGRGVLPTLAAGGILVTALDRIGVASTPDRARPLALVFLLAGAALAVSVLAHVSLDYRGQAARMSTRRQRADAVHLARAVRYEAWLAVYFVVAWLTVRRWSSETLEFLVATLGYLAFVIVCGRIHQLAAIVGRPSISEAIRHSRAVTDLKGALPPWHQTGIDDGAPPGVNRAARLLAALPRVGEASAPLSLLATLVAAVAFANAGPALESTATVVKPLIAEKPRSSRATTEQRAQATRTPRVTPAPASPDKQAPPQATYVARCGRHREPGRGAPSPVDTKLRNLWLGAQGVGALLGGCADRARLVRPDSGIWYAAGRDGETVVSLGVVAADGKFALLLGGAARFATRRALDGSLFRVSARVGIGHGDLEVVGTRLGSYVFVRREVRHGGRSVPYSVVPPGLATAWLASARTAGWTWPATEQVRGHVTVFSFRAETGKVVGAALCTSDTWCSSTIRGVVANTLRGDAVTLDHLVAVAPPAIRP